MEEDRTVTSIFPKLAAGVVAVCAFGLIVAWWRGGQGETIFEGINAMFSGLAFAGLFCALVMQRKELKLQREELRLTRTTLKATSEATQEQARISTLAFF